MPASGVTVKAAFQPIAFPVFTDVPSGSYYEEAVRWAAENGVTAGTDSAHFSPDGICTRAQAVTFLWRAAGSPAPKSATMPFIDVPAGSYYYDAVLWAVENGITKGHQRCCFQPRQDLHTRTDRHVPVAQPKRTGSWQQQSLYRRRRRRLLRRRGAVGGQE